MSDFKAVVGPELEKSQQHRNFLDNGCDLRLRKCDSLFSTCCDGCKQRKLLVDKERKHLADKCIIVPRPFSAKPTARPRDADSDNSVSLSSINVVNKSSAGFSWDMWSGRTIEFDFCRKQNADRKIILQIKTNNCFSNLPYLPYQRQRENWLCSRIRKTGNVPCKAPLYLRGTSNLSTNAGQRNQRHLNETQNPPGFVFH